jgi:hypothetical protein
MDTADFAMANVPGFSRPDNSEVNGTLSNVIESGTIGMPNFFKRLSTRLSYLNVQFHLSDGGVAG